MNDIWQDIRDNGMPGTIYATYFNIIRNKFDVNYMLSEVQFIIKLQHFLLEHRNKSKK
jgi:hypothetical protein